MAEFKKSEINIEVLLDENRVPEALFWSAEDGDVYKEEAKAMLLSMWDSKANETLRIDLWTKDMPVDEMKKFFTHIRVALCDTFHHETHDEKMTSTMKDSDDYFAEKINLINE